MVQTLFNKKKNVQQRYIMLMSIFSALFSISCWLLEEIEGRKIEHSMYVEFGAQWLLAGSVLGLFLFFFTALPVTFLLQKWNTPFWIKTVVYLVLGGLAGVLISHYTFAFFSEEYGITKRTGGFIFSAAGLVYALVDARTAASIQKK